MLLKLEQVQQKTPKTLDLSKIHKDFEMEFTSQPVDCFSALIGAKILDAISNEIKRAPFKVIKGFIFY